MIHIIGCKHQHVWGFCFALQVLIVKTHKSNTNLINSKLTEIKRNKKWPSNSSQNVISHGLRISLVLVRVPTLPLDHSYSLKEFWNLFHEMHQICRGHLCQNPSIWFMTFMWTIQKIDIKSNHFYQDNMTIKWK